MKIRIILLIVIYGFFTETALAADRSKDELIDKLALLDKISYHPNLLPIILRNIDYLELSPRQVQSLNSWRKNNAALMLSKMEEIARERIEFMEAAVNPSTMEDELQQRQKALFKLQEEVLEYKLSCRRNIINTFTPQQWDNLLFLLSDVKQAFAE